MKGPGTNAEQIRKLKAKMVLGDVDRANSIVKDNRPDTISLAYRLMRANVVKNKLPKTIIKLLDNLPEDDAKIVRNKLAQALEPVKVDVMP